MAHHTTGHGAGSHGGHHGPPVLRGRQVTGNWLMIVAGAIPGFFETPISNNWSLWGISLLVSVVLFGFSYWLSCSQGRLGTLHNPRGPLTVAAMVIGGVLLLGGGAYTAAAHGSACQPTQPGTATDGGGALAHAHSVPAACRGLDA